MIERYSTPEMGSIWSDESRIREMLRVELEYLKVLAPIKGIPGRELKAFEERIDRVSPVEVKALEEKSQHDVVALLEAALKPIESRAPRLARYLHYGLTSSDVLDTALAVQCVRSLELLDEAWAEVEAELKSLARRHKDTFTVGRTHGVHAEPLSFGVKLAGWLSEASRNRRRLAAAREAIAYGKLSGAVGNFAHVEPAWEARALRSLGLKPEPVATQVVPRDRHAELLAALALSAAALERFATEIRHLQRTEVLEASEPFGSGQKGSSAMPHKRNPVLCENLCGLARLVRANALAALENVALWHERDISHSSVERVILPDSMIALHFMLRRFLRVLKGLNVDVERMRANLDRLRGLVYSQKLLLALTDAGLPRLKAYELVQRNAMKAWESGADFRLVLSQDAELGRVLSAEAFRSIFSPAAYNRHAGALLKRAGA